VGVGEGMSVGVFVTVTIVGIIVAVTLEVGSAGTLVTGDGSQEGKNGKKTG